MEKFKIPGISLGIIRDGQIVHARGYGYSNVEHQVPVKLETVFQSGSVGKQFTAMAIMILVERGKLGLDFKINNYFKDTPIQWNNITVRHLLTHTSGMTNYPDNFNFRTDYTEDELYEIIQKIPLTFQPGEQWAYSNIGYVMLGVLIRRVTNQFYGDFLKENIFTPLGMTTAQVISEADIILNRASGYVLVDGELKNQPWVSPTLNTLADGALYLTVYDMIKWDAGLYSNELLKNETSFDAMWTPVKLNNGITYPYGFGWRLWEGRNGMRIMEHGGRWQGFQAIIIRVPEKKLMITLFINLSSPNVYEVALAILQLYYPELGVIPKSKGDEKLKICREIQDNPEESVRPHLDRMISLTLQVWSVSNKPQFSQDTQVVALLLFVHSYDKRLLEQVRTDNRKTFIVEVTAVFFVLCGNAVNIVSSNRDLAIEGEQKCHSLFQLLKIESDCTCSENDKVNHQFYRSDLRRMWV
ncbi:unnamed protein product [Rotaria sp. Silwood2]|nr:unnamed protein product [Rotaria sp. Silwood2]